MPEHIMEKHDIISLVSKVAWFVKHFADLNVNNSIHTD